VEAVNTALYLRRPLLVEGEAGCGKTRLAYAVAFELGYPLKECYIRSTSRARDLLYTFDAVRRLYDIQAKKKWKNTEEPPPPEEYVKPGGLGEAFDLSRQDIPAVVLIDEIDKADLDFANDLLLELERYWFKVDEVGGDYRVDALKGQPLEARKPFLPLIIITSNREKELPKPFLRRCLYYFLEFPKDDLLAQIVAQHPEIQGVTPLYTEALNKFLALREHVKMRWRKKPGTSELLDYILRLKDDESQGKINDEKLAQEPLSALKHIETLVKTQSDLEAVKNLKS